MSRQQKNIDKQLDNAKRQFARTALILRKAPQFIKKAKSFGRATGSLPPEQFIVTLATYLISALARTKNPKQLLKMLESEFGPEVMKGVVSLVETLMEMDEIEPLMEMDEIDTQFWIDVEPALLSVMDSPKSNLTVAKMNEELRRLVKGEKGVSSDKGPTKEQQLKRFFAFFDLFQKKLAEFNITDDEKIASMLVSLTNMVPRIKIKNKDREDGKK